MGSSTSARASTLMDGHDIDRCAYLASHSRRTHLLTCRPNCSPCPQESDNLWSQAAAPIRGAARRAPATTPVAPGSAPSPTLIADFSAKHGATGRLHTGQSRLITTTAIAHSVSLLSAEGDECTRQQVLTGAQSIGHVLLLKVNAPGSMRQAEREREPHCGVGLTRRTTVFTLGM